MQDECVWASIGIGVGFGLIGTGMLIGGGFQRARYNDFKRQSAELEIDLSPLPGGAGLGVRGGF